MAGRVLTGVRFGFKRLSWRSLGRCMKLCAWVETNHVFILLLSIAGDAQPEGGVLTATVDAVNAAS